MPQKKGWKGCGGKKGPKRDPADREAILEKTAQLSRRGYSQAEIAAIMGVSQMQVSNDLKAVKERYRKAMLMEAEAAMQEKLDQYKEIRKEAWEAWERSKEDARKETREVYSTGSAEEAQERIKEIVVKEGRIPENQYLNTILRTLEAERQLLGLDKEKPATMNGVFINWEELTGRSSIQDPIATRLAEIEALPSPQEATPVEVEEGGVHEETQEEGDGS